MRARLRPTGMTAARPLLVLLLVSAVVVAILPFMLPAHLVTLLSLVFVAGLLAASVDLLAGNVGLVSLGHAGIAAAAGYGVAWATVNEHGVVVQLVLALGLTLVVSAVYAITTMRTNGIVFLMITLALGIVVYGLSLKLSTITGGQNGLTGIQRPGPVGDPRAFYLLAAVAFGIAAFLRWRLARSPFGLVLRGTRASESRMSSLGYSVTRVKFAAVMLSGLLAGAAGVLVVWQAQFISPNVASFGRSAMAVVMVIVGGAGSLLGPLLGAGVVVGTEHWLSSYVERWPTLLGLVFIAVVLFAPGGIVGAVARRRREGMRDRRLAGSGAAAPTAPLLEEEPVDGDADPRLAKPGAEPH